MKAKLPPGAADALRQLDTHLNPVWQLGRNAVVAWSPHATGLRLLVTPVRDVLALLERSPNLLRGPRHREPKPFDELCAVTGLEPVEIVTSLRIGAHDYEVPWLTVEGILRRYSITETPHRAVALFDIVGFSKLSPIQQVGQLNSLESAINIAQRRLRDWGVAMELARSTTGDGFYLWNRRTGVMAEVAMLMLVFLILADMEIERSRDRHGLIPTLRAAFSVGCHYAYYQVEGLSPRGYEYIVGDVTIHLARLMGEIKAGQVLVGLFERPARADGEEGGEMLSAADIVARADAKLRQLVGREFNGDRIAEARIRLTGESGAGHDVVVIGDKHGQEHRAHNAVAQLCLGGRPPILIGTGVSRTKAAS